MNPRTARLGAALIAAALHAAGAAAAESVVKKIGSALKKAAEETAYTAKSIAKAAVRGVEQFDPSVKTEDLLTPELKKQCPGIEEVDGCSVPLRDKRTKRFKKLFQPACIDHDLCYRLSDSRSACDVAFRNRMYRICKKVSVKTSFGLCKIAAHTWFASVTHTRTAASRHRKARKWARKHCKPPPLLERGTKLRMGR